MRASSSWRNRLGQVLLGSAIVLALVAPRGTLAQGRDDRGQDLKGWDGKAPESQPVHLTTDWSHRHVVFSPPKDLVHQFQLSGNVRYVQQLVRRNAVKKGDPNEWRWRRAPESPNLLHGDWSLDMGTGAKVGAGMYPAKYSFDATSATCATDAIGNPLPSPDFVVYNTSLPGSATQATIAAFTNLYSSCPTVSVDSPNTYWAYNTGTTGAVVTSVVLSGDGNQVAFVQNNASTATLVLLKWAAYDGFPAGPTTPANSASAAAYNTCVTTTAGPCMFTITFSTANGDVAAFDTNSSPFYDYASDTLYAGNDDGFLHKFVGVFKGNAAATCGAGIPLCEVVLTAGANLWPAAVDPGAVLTSPVFDDGSGRIFVGDNTVVLSRVDATIGGGTGGIVPSGSLGSNGIDDAPILNPSLDNVYVFVRGDNGGGTNKRAGVYQFTAGFAVNTTGTEVQVSSTSIRPVTAMYAGDFDNIYYTSAGGTGNMYVCSTNAGITALWQITMTAGVPTAATAGPTLTTANVPCSPVTEFFNSSNTSRGAHPNGTDLIFLSVTGSAQVTPAINCPFSFPGLGCIMSFDVTTPGPTQTVGATNVTGGTSGVIVDNSSATTGASQVYFTPLGNQNCTTSRATGGCAIQASQSGLI